MNGNLVVGAVIAVAVVAALALLIWQRRRGVGSCGCRDCGCCRGKDGGEGCDRTGKE